MRSLFIRIFLAFWAIVTLAGGIMAVAAYLSHPHDEPRFEQNIQFVARGLDSYAEDALKILRDGGIKAWREHLATLDWNSPLPIVVTVRRQSLLGEPVSPEAIDLAERVFASGAPQTLSSPHQIGFGRPLLLPDRTPAVLVVMARRPGPPDGPRPAHRPPPRVLIVEQLLIFLVIGGLVCFWLTRSLTAPIHKLRAATRRFAAGDFSTRVGKSIRGKGELSDLAHDFDRMAERIADLLDAQKRLQRDISHELRSPLARLNIALELARRRSGPEAGAALDRIEREAERMNDMIGQLLSLNLLESGTRQLRKEAVNLNALVEEIVADADFEARDRRRSVVLRQGGPLWVQGSRELLRRGIENVIRNGVHYTDEDSAVEVDLSQVEDEARIRIRDHGPGVAEEELEKIFQPFYRTAVARDRKSGGTGIGLAIVERAIRRHGGTVVARNAPDGGLVVDIVLPVGSDANPEQE